MRAARRANRRWTRWNQSRPIDRVRIVIGRLAGAGRSAALAATTPVETIAAAMSADVARAYPDYRRRQAVTALGLAAPAAWVSRSRWRVMAALGAVGAISRLQARNRHTHSPPRPPGDLSPSTQMVRDPQRLFELAERHGPIFTTSHFRQPTVCVVGLPEIGRLLRDHSGDLAPASMEHTDYAPDGLLRWMSGETHAAFRELFAPALGASLHDLQRGAIADHFDRMLARIADGAGRAGFAPHDAFVEPIGAMWLELFFGLGVGTAENRRANGLLQKVDVFRPDARPETSAGLESVLFDSRPLHELTVVGRLEARRPGTSDDPLVRRNLIYTAQSTLSDVASLAAWTLVHAAGAPEWLDRLRAGQGADLGPRGDIAAAMVSETLRLSQSEYLLRRATRDFVFDGFTVPAGWMVRLCMRESHRDPRLFEDPDQYDPSRFADSDLTAPQAFGAGDHRCLGEHAARRVCATFLTRVASGYDVETVRDRGLRFSASRHWVADVRLRLVNRSPQTARISGGGDRDHGAGRPRPTGTAWY